ncbi:MAG: indolepyruvate ferredoxin oxidoreductase subunit alpha [Desulfobacteraceae bacterium]|nr:indolepyruvate ferredoxin oxidoreductase subunit alpha [Desulfobacteraceae bacterium]
MHELLEDKPGKKALLLGNEAIVRGAMEAGLAVSAAYPGTPSSEIGNSLSGIARDQSSGLYFEFSINEKVAMELTAAAAACDLRSLTCLKHVGLNVASDVLVTLAYIGVKAGMVIVCSDDPSLHSSQNEQDNRAYARLADLPMLEPSSPHEAKEMAKEAFEISETLGLPVILRTTTRTSHVRGPVEYGRLPESKKTRGLFQKDPERWVAIPTFAKPRHKVLADQMKKAERLSTSSRFNWKNGCGKTGIVASGASACYVADAIHDLNCAKDVTFLRLGFTYPHPRDLIAGFLKDMEKVLVVEELEPFQELAIKAIAQEEGLAVPIYGKDGKDGGYLPRLYEFTPQQVRNAIARLLGLDIKRSGLPDLSGLPELPRRLAGLCQGCPHAQTYGAVKEALKELDIEKDTICPTDIGCYLIGVLPPIQMGDYLICMGSSAGTAMGFSVATDRKVVSFIGDSTFFHAGIPPLINAVYHGHRFCLVIMDNSITAMTGHQPNPGTPEHDRRRVSIEQVVRGCGVKNLVKINPYKKRESIDTIKTVLAKDELSVIISEAPCVLHAKRMEGKK